jgi:hypothetical protein
MNSDRSTEKPNVGNGLTMLIAIALFAWHWSWLRARAAEERAASDRRA